MLDSKRYYVSKWHVLEYIRIKRQVRVRDLVYFFHWYSGFATTELQILTKQGYLKRLQQENGEAPHYELGKKAEEFLEEFCYGNGISGFLDGNKKNKYIKKSKELAKCKHKSWVDSLYVFL